MLRLTERADPNGLPTNRALIQALVEIFGSDALCCLELPVLTLAAVTTCVETVSRRAPVAQTRRQTQSSAYGAQRRPHFLTLEAASPLVHH
jgi:hypothetical protein